MTTITLGLVQLERDGDRVIVNGSQELRLSRLEWESLVLLADLVRLAETRQRADRLELARLDKLVAELRAKMDEYVRTMEAKHRG